MKSVIQILSGAVLATSVAAKRYMYTTETVTECFSTRATEFGPPAPTQGPDRYWTIQMPECRGCECPGCAYTHEYTATFDVFYPGGIAKWPYSIREVYRGMSKMPVVATPTAIPYAFATSVETCRICGDEPIVATMTYPLGAHPFQQHVPHVTAPPSSKSDAPSTTATQMTAEDSAAPSVVVDNENENEAVVDVEETPASATGKFVIRGGAWPASDDATDRHQADDEGMLKNHAVTQMGSTTSSDADETPTPTATSRRADAASNRGADFDQDSSQGYLELGIWAILVLPLTLLI